MKSGDEYARELFEDAKCCLASAKLESDDLLKQRHLRHGMLAAFSFIELQIDLIAQHFKGSDFFTLHERGIINQVEVTFDKGTFKSKPHSEKFSRLSDRPLNSATYRRNTIAHPRAVVTLMEDDVERDLEAVLAATNDLFNIVFKKPLPYFALGLKPKI